MTREEAIAELKTRYFSMSQCLQVEELHKANESIDLAIEALQTEPCEDCISFPKGTLKKRGKGYVVYNVEWLKKHWQTELNVVGIESEDAISRQEVLDKLERSHITIGVKSRGTLNEYIDLIMRIIGSMPSVKPEQKVGKWEYWCYQNMKCSRCGYVIAEEDSVEFCFCPNCGCRMEEGE